MSDFAGIAELAALLGVSKQRASQIAARDDFPASVANLAAGPVWRRSAIEKWAQRTGRKIDVRS